MAGITTIVASLLLLNICGHHVAPASPMVIPSACCMTFISQKVPENRVVSYHLSSGSVCPKAGVIFTTKKGHKFCGDPKQPWVQKYMKNLDAKRKKPSSGARAAGAKSHHRGHKTTI
ncbi:C-C motif chemokine 24 [Carlito syrichta]|uniref:C-C motif chemokine 24 n=1 Tax=Carlito syrichta TaxID=1868482 RepID=A0A1U7U4H9_CARSF|nr:C-C motif chemokine 24 [Carlito syrichta]